MFFFYYGSSYDQIFSVYIFVKLLNLLRQSQKTDILIKELRGFLLGLRKKLETVSKKSAFKEIGPWINCIINHMYYCASTTPDGNPDIIEAKWRMLPLLSQNIHGQCTHEPLTEEA